jgi:predicted  nucleic acid-binding Zn-ribbon protein
VRHKCPNCGGENVSEVDTDYWSQTECKDCGWSHFIDFEYESDSITIRKPTAKCLEVGK